MSKIRQIDKKLTPKEAGSDEIYIQKTKRQLQTDYQYLVERLYDNFLIDILDYNYPAALRKIVDSEISAYSLYEYYLLLSSYVQKTISDHKFFNFKQSQEDYVISRIQEIFPGLELKLNSRDSASKGKIAIKVLATQFRTSTPTIERLLKQAKSRAQWFYKLEPLRTSLDLLRAWYSLIVTHKCEAEQKLNGKLKRRPFENKYFLMGNIEACSKLMELLTKQINIQEENRKHDKQE